ncbi:MAG: gliding motility protein GldN, partial [Prevotella sp.]
MMRKILIVILALLAVEGASAQSAKRRAEQAEAQARKSNQNQLSTRAQISFPTQAEMQEDVVWRRDVYREIDLTQDANAGLYYPVEPQGTQMNLFPYMFKLML